MKAFFKENNKIIINSMTYDEALVGKTFLDMLADKHIKAEQRNDINDDFDGLVLTIEDGAVYTKEEIEKVVEEAVVVAKEEAYLKAKTETQLKSATDINISKSTLPSEENIRTNASKCSILTGNNKITIVDEGLIEYVGGPFPEPKKWVGLLVDLNTKVQGDIYNIEEIDYSDAKRWGASNDTTFVMWVTPDISGKEITFTNINDETQSTSLVIEFTEAN